MERKRARAWISGRVQGVCFRYYTVEEARRLGVDGWVRNLPDGRVELVAEGEPDRVEALLEWCHRGPSSARVVDVEVADEAPEGELDGFTVRR